MYAYAYLHICIVISAHAFSFAELESRLKFALAANLPMATAMQQSVEIVQMLQAKKGNSMQFLAGCLANYFVKGDFFRVILQEALGPQQLEGFLLFLRLLDDVWLEMDSAKPKPHRVVMGDQVLACPTPALALTLPNPSPDPA